MKKLSENQKIANADNPLAFSVTIAKKVIAKNAPANMWRKEKQILFSKLLERVTKEQELIETLTLREFSNQIARATYQFCRKFGWKKIRRPNLRTGKIGAYWKKL